MYNNLPELTVTKCILHKLPDIDVLLDKLSNTLEVRLKHKGCSHEHKLKPEVNELILERILKLRKQLDSGVDTICDCSVDHVSSVSCSESASSVDYMTYPQDKYDIEQIRQARELLIKKRISVLNDPSKLCTVDLMKTRRCLRQYKNMENSCINSDHAN